MRNRVLPLVDLARSGDPPIACHRPPVDIVVRATARYTYYVETVSHREMRNHSGDILRRVAAGESVQVSNNGRPVALIVPIGGNALDGLIARGEARAARSDVHTLAGIARVSAAESSHDLLEDVRGRW